MKNLKTVTVGISAYNEEANISRLLQAIVTQNSSNYKLEKVIVACDGCTDNTAKIVEQIISKYKIVKLINDGKRLGKATRLNNFYKENFSDIFISFDADVILADNNVISEIVKKFDNPKVGLVGGNNLPLPPNNFFEKIIYTWLYIWHEIRKDLNKGITIHNHLGCVSALSKNLAKHIIIPNNKIPDDDFVYLMSIKLGFEFKFADKALVYYKTVDNLKDFLMQHGRLVKSKKYAIDHFGNWAKKIYDVPGSTKIAVVRSYLIKDPLFTSLALTFQALLRKGFFVPKEKYKGGFWKTAASSKKLPE